jgi:hypothetical protein
MDVALIPAGIIAGFLLKRDDLLSRADKFAYLVFSVGVSHYAPSAIRDFYPTVSDNGMGLLSFGCALFGGLILLNFWRILSRRQFWETLIERIMR